MIQFLKKTSHAFVFIALICGTVFAAPNFSFNPGAQWEPKPLGPNSGWIAKDKKATLFVSSDKLPTGVYTIQDSDAPKIVKLIEQLQNFKGQAQGMKNWKVKKFQFSSAFAGKGSLLRMEGDYMGFTGKKVQFVEWHYYIGSSHYRLVYAQDAVRGVLNKKSAESVLSLFRPEGVSS